MSTRQITACAGRLPEPERAQFLDLMTRAAAASGMAGELRRQAWALYRGNLGLPDPPAPDPPDMGDSVGSRPRGALSHAAGLFVATHAADSDGSRSDGSR